MYDGVRSDANRRSGGESALPLSKMRTTDGLDRPEVLAKQLTWQPEQAVPPLQIDLNVFFADVVGE